MSIMCIYSIVIDTIRDLNRCLFGPIWVETPRWLPVMHITVLIGSYGTDGQKGHIRPFIVYLRLIGSVVCVDSALAVTHRAHSVHIVYTLNVT